MLGYIGGNFGRWLDTLTNRATRYPVPHRESRSGQAITSGPRGRMPLLVMTIFRSEVSLCPHFGLHWPQGRLRIHRTDRFSVSIFRRINLPPTLRTSVAPEVGMLRSSTS